MKTQFPIPPVGFFKEEFSRLLLLVSMSTRHEINNFEQIEQGGGHLWPQGYNLNKLCSCPQGDATYQISTLLAF